MDKSSSRTDQDHDKFL